MAVGDGMALMLVSHEGIDRREVQDARRRWPDVVVKDLAQEEPMWEMTPDEAADLGRCRRGVEPLRIVVMLQYDRQAITAPVVEPMRVLV